MPRSTKEEALATRSRLLDAAERVFQAKGLSGTSLADIAAEAGTTRGAIYWHFRDKADLFNAMIERVSLPLEHSLQEAAQARPDPLPILRAAVLQALQRTVSDPQTRRVFEVATHKVEYVEGVCAVRQRHLDVRSQCVEDMKTALARSARHRGVRLPVPVEAAARGLHALVDGLIQNWLLDTGAFDLPACGRRAMDTYLNGLGLPLSKD
ncbi:MAG TPA: TetR family transcriptional regulator [Ramlibacter sp.]|nr:TetR family transcriptional regulator [Ramlibacter sp.]